MILNNKRFEIGIILSNIKSKNKMIKYNITRSMDLVINLSFINQIK